MMPNDRSDSLWRTVRAVAWSFFGVRNSGEFQQDVQKLRPAQVVIGGIVGGVLFVLVLVALVKWVVGSGVAA